MALINVAAPVAPLYHPAGRLPRHYRALRCGMPMHCLASLPTPLKLATASPRYMLAISADGFAIHGILHRPPVNQCPVVFLNVTSLLQHGSVPL